MAEQGVIVTRIHIYTAVVASFLHKSFDRILVIQLFKIMQQFYSLQLYKAKSINLPNQESNSVENIIWTRYVFVKHGCSRQQQS